MGMGVNPFLPVWEYIPDGEPHVFGDRIYLFGSHDTEGGKRYCAEQNYVGWSAPLSDPTAWEYAGVIYEASQDPDFTEDHFCDLYAPDVVRGNDGRYYLYYGFSDDGHDKIRAAVCDEPNGHYEYYGYVKNPDGNPVNEYLMGDPAVINDNGIIRMYCGWSLSMVAAGAHSQGRGMEDEKRHNPAAGSDQAAKRLQMPKPGSDAMRYALQPIYKMLFHRNEEATGNLEYPLMGANTFELEDDMLTIRGRMKRIVAGQFDTPEESSFYGHAFYEASSIRKIYGTYYFIYSSENSNELCYATSRYPDRDFVYRGTIISNGDVGYNGRRSEDRLNMTANDHGSLECINGQWYIFHHRQTHRSTFSRQACVERVEIKADGSIAQVECTSMGFNDGPLKTEGVYPAVISCVLTNGHMPHCTNTLLEDDIPCITNDGEDRFITGISDGTVIGYKYFAFHGQAAFGILYRSEGGGTLDVYADEEKIAEFAVQKQELWSKQISDINTNGTKALYLKYRGQGHMDIKDIFFK